MSIFGYFFGTLRVLVGMTQKISFNYSLVLAVMISLTVCYVAVIFSDEDRVYPEPKAYVVGATPPTIVMWEM